MVNVSAESFAHFQELIDQFNLEHGTEYRIEFDEVLECEGRNRSELLSFYQSMTDEEFFQLVLISLIQVKDFPKQK